MTSSPDQASPDREDSTLDSSAQECESLGNAKSTQPADESSKDIGPTSPASTTSELFVSNQRREIRQMPVAPALAISGGLTQEPFLLISSAAESPAKTSQSQETGPDSPAPGQDSSLTSPESPTSLFDPAVGSYLKTFPDSFPQTVAEISESFSRRWPKSGFTTSPGECSTAVTSECPKTGAVSSSLQDVLEDQVPDRYYLSQKAAAGILRRSAKRNRKLPERLQTALETVASS